MNDTTGRFPPGGGHVSADGCILVVESPEGNERPSPKVRIAPMGLRRSTDIFEEGAAFLIKRPQ